MNSFYRKTLPICFLWVFVVACGSSANLSGNPNAQPGGSSTAVPTMSSASTGDVANIPDTSSPDDQTFIFDCTDKDADPAADYVTVTCESDTSSTVYLYYCVSGVVTREIEDSSDDPVTLYPTTNVECENVDGTPTLTETELIVS